MFKLQGKINEIHEIGSGNKREKGVKKTQKKITNKKHTPQRIKSGCPSNYIYLFLKKGQKKN